MVAEFRSISMALLFSYQAALLATVFAAATIPVTHLLLLRVVRRSALTTPLAFPCFGLSVVFFFVLARTLDMPFDAPRILFGLGVLGFLQLGYLAVMFHLYRGFSNTLLTDVHRLENPSFQDILREFAEGSGAPEMLRRRLATMESYELITREGSTLRWTPKGRRSAWISGLYKNIFRMRSTG